MFFEPLVWVMLKLLEKTIIWTGMIRDGHHFLFHTLWTTKIMNFMIIEGFFNSWLLEEWSFLGPCLFWEWSTSVMNEFYCIIESLKLWDVWRKSFSKCNDAKSCGSFRSFQSQLTPKRWLMASILKSKICWATPESAQNIKRNLFQF